MDMMRHHKMVGTILAGALALTPLTGCENLPGTPKTQGAVIGGAGGAAAGAAIAKDNRLLGALIGGLVGAGGGYLIGAHVDKVKDKDTEGAQAAVDDAQANPAKAEDVWEATTADLNNDGFVTMDEVVAMDDAGLSDDEIVDRLEATGQIFELSAEQRAFLEDRGVSPYVVAQMETINQTARQGVEEDLERSGEVISRPRSQG